jgi:phage terminase small subunit
MPRKQLPIQYEDKPDYLSVREFIFLKEYMITGNQYQSAIKAGYPEKSASSQASRFLSSDRAQNFIKECTNHAGWRVADTTEALEFLTSVMRGEVADTFGLETSVADRLKATKELLDRIEGSTTQGQVTIINNIPRPETVIEVQN